MHQKLYKWNPSDYANYSEGQHNWAIELIDKIHITGSESLLDIGCGDGKVSALIASHLPEGQVVGIDSSLEMVTLACERFPPNKHKNLKFLHLDAQDLDFVSKFDVVFSNAVLHWIEDHRNVLKRVEQSLCQFGRLLFQMGGTGNAAGMVAAFDQVITSSRWSQYFGDFNFPYSFYGQEEYINWLIQVGFEPVRVELIPKEMKHKGINGLTGWLRTTWHPYTERIPPGLRDGFLSDVVFAYLEEHPLNDHGDAIVKMVRLEVEAFKP